MSEKGVTTITLKKINKGKVYRYIYDQRQTSKLQIVQELQMGLSTVSQNLSVLEQEGLIERNGYFESTGGRKAQVIRIVPDKKIAVGVGLLKDRLHLCAVNLYGEAVLTKTLPLAYRDDDAYYAQAADSIGAFLEQSPYTKEQILGVSIATQGIIDPAGDRVLYGAIMGNSDMRRNDFADRLAFPCRLEHDSKAAARLELHSHPGLDSALLLLLNSNLGGGVITNRSIHGGSSMHSGSIEHICLRPDGPLCYCGSRGCLETYCSAGALEKAAKMSAEDFFAQLRTGEDAQLQAVWNTYLDHLAFAIRNLNMVLDCPVILSGYLAPFFIEEDLAYLTGRINDSAPFAFPRGLLLVGAHGQYTPAIGAALYYVEEFLRSVCG